MRSRRVDYSESTRQALVDSAVELFTKRGYAATSLDAVASRSRVTKGALYHHFSGKQALFEAAFDQVERSIISRLADAVGEPATPWQQALNGLRAYIEVCLDPAYQRIAIHEGPVVMGWERWREAEEHFSYGLIRAVVESLVDAGEIEEVPIEVTARILFGALGTGAAIIADAADPKKAGQEVSTTIGKVLEGLRRNRPAEPPVNGSRTGGFDLATLFRRVTGG